MRARLAPLRPLLIMVLLIAIPVLILVVVNLLVPNVTVDTSLHFQNIAPETSVQVGDYRLEYTNRSVVLENTLTRQMANIVQGYDPAALPPAYTLFQFEGQPYLITRLAAGGSSGAYGFKVIKLASDHADDLTDPTNNPNIGLSCSNPRVDGNALVFEISLHCAAGAAVHDSSYQTYRITLK